MRLPLVAALALVLAGGCAHTKTTDEGRESREGEDQKATGGSEKTETQKSHAGGGTHEPTHRESGGDHSVPLATAPGGLLAAGAEDKIRKRLAAQGCLDDDAKGSGGALSAGLRRCQKAHDLPETGMPDDATIKALGLNPDQIFRHGPVKD
jgi:hypothetical protein